HPAPALLRGLKRIQRRYPRFARSFPKWRANARTVHRSRERRLENANSTARRSECQRHVGPYECTHCPTLSKRERRSETTTTGRGCWPAHFSKTYQLHHPRPQPLTSAHHSPKRSYPLCSQRLCEVHRRRNAAADLLEILKLTVRRPRHS